MKSCNAFVCGSGASRARSVLLVVVLLLGWSGFASAQTVSKTLAYDIADALLNVNGYTTSLKIDAAAAVAITPVCAVNGAVVTCQNPIALTSGNHTIVVTVANAGGSAAGTLNYVAPTPAVQPSNIKIIVNITIP